MNDTPQLLDCGHTESPHSDITRGYGIDSNGKKHCYNCCTERDKEQMRKDGKITLYLTHEPYSKPARIARHDNYRNGYVSNWPGVFKLHGQVKRGNHNITRYRYDIWFTFEGQSWHGVQYGDNTQICHCRKVNGGK